MKLLLVTVFLFFPFFSLLAKPIDERCQTEQGDTFQFGTGSFFDPYLICNTAQLTHLSQDNTLFSFHFKLGVDLSYQDKEFHIIGSATHPFTGGFDGDGHTLSDINLDNTLEKTHVAPFAYLKNARLENLTIHHITLTRFISQAVGAMVAEADSSTLFNLHATGIDLSAPDSSGGIVARLKQSFLASSSVEGRLRNHFGSDASGGMIGRCTSSTISSSYASVTLVNTSKNPFGVSFIGGFAGVGVECSFNDIYATGNIDYTFAEHKGPRYIGGLFGGLSKSRVIRAFYVGKIDIQADFVGGAIGGLDNTLLDSVYWDKERAGIEESEGGVGENTATLKQRSFWLAQDFSERIWQLKDGQYPTLIFDN